jgi:GxxExxY protein
MEDGNKVIYKDLSYAIVGAAYKTFKAIGYGMPEKYCQAAFAEELKKLGLKFEKEFYVTLNYEGKPVMRLFLDFLIDDKIVVEFKVVPKMGYVHIDQVMGYLKATNKKLAILLYFTKEGIKYRRILNSYKMLP